MAAQPQAFANEYTRVLEALSRHQVDFVICGGIACLLHGSTRQTYDIDLCVRLEDGNLLRLIAALREVGLQSRIPEPMESLADSRKREEWDHRKNAMEYTLVSPRTPLQVDVFLHYPIGFEELKSGATRMKVGELNVAVSSKEHLIAAKLKVQPPRQNDLIDIAFLETLIRNE